MHVSKYRKKHFTKREIIGHEIFTYDKDLSFLIVHDAVQQKLNPNRRLEYELKNNR